MEGVITEHDEQAAEEIYTTWVSIDITDIAQIIAKSREKACGKCPKVKAAGALKEALGGITDACDEYAAEFIKHERACDWGIVNEAFLARSAALKQAKEAGI